MKIEADFSISDYDAKYTNKYTKNYGEKRGWEVAG